MNKNEETLMKMIDAKLLTDLLEINVEKLEECKANEDRVMASYFRGKVHAFSLLLGREMEFIKL